MSLGEESDLGENLRNTFYNLLFTIPTDLHREGNIFFYCLTREEFEVLENSPDASSILEQIFGGECSDISSSIIIDVTVLELLGTEDRTYEARLAAPRGSDDEYKLSWVDREIDISQDGTFSIGESDFFELHVLWYDIESKILDRLFEISIFYSDGDGMLSLTESERAHREDEDITTRSGLYSLTIDRDIYLTDLGADLYLES